jgi:hypothetical protein
MPELTRRSIKAAMLLSRCPLEAHCGVKSDIAPCPKSADTVAKVENQTSPKISRKSIFRGLSRCNALWRRYEGPWSILDETMWSLTSPRAKRIRSPKKFRSSPKKDFFNTICQ